MRYMNSTTECNPLFLAMGYQSIPPSQRDSQRTNNKNDNSLTDLLFVLSDLLAHFQNNDFIQFSGRNYEFSQKLM